MPMESTRSQSIGTRRSPGLLRGSTSEVKVSQLAICGSLRRRRLSSRAATCRSDIKSSRGTMGVLSLAHGAPSAEHVRCLASDCNALWPVCGAIDAHQRHRKHLGNGCGHRPRLASPEDTLAVQLGNRAAAPAGSNRDSGGSVVSRNPPLPSPCSIGDPWAGPSRSNGKNT